jgi:hypothetical protein
MQNFHEGLFLLRRLSFWALIGFAVIFLIGPALALISVLFSFALIVFSTLVPLALIGFMVWLPIQAVRRKRIVTWDHVRGTGRAFCRTAVVAPVRTGVRLGHGAMSCGRQMRTKCQAVAYLVRGILVEMICGALVGVLLGAIAGTQYERLALPISLGAGIGAALGLLVAASRLRSVQQSFLDQAPEEPAC